MSRVVVVGAGAIGSNVLSYLARMLAVTAVWVIDRDVYELPNVAGQNIRRADVGKSKAVVQARRLRQISRRLVTRAVHGDVEDVPLGWLRCDVILACLDSVKSRMAVNERAQRLGVPWIDAGIEAAGLLARVRSFLPSDDGPCFECAMDDVDYARVEERYPCHPGAGPPATGAPASLGALAASLMAIECEQLLSADRANALAGREVLLDARHHRHYVTSFQPNRDCRLPHARWEIRRCNIDPTATLAELMATAATFCGPLSDVRLRVEGAPLANEPACRTCGNRLQATCVWRGPRRTSTTCPACGNLFSAGGFDLYDSLELDAFPGAVRNRSLSEMGLLPGDVVTLSTSGLELHLELIGEP